MNCKGVPNMDFEGTSDVFIKAFIDPASKQATDTHYRCQTGNPSFNYTGVNNICDTFYMIEL